MRATINAAIITIAATPDSHPDCRAPLIQIVALYASFAYVLMCAVRRIGLAHTHLAVATCAGIRLKLLKIGALVRVSVRRIKIAMASACPYQDEFALAHARIRAAAP